MIEKGEVCCKKWKENWPILQYYTRVTNDLEGMARLVFEYCPWCGKKLPCGKEQDD